MVSCPCVSHGLDFFLRDNNSYHPLKQVLSINSFNPHKPILYLGTLRLTEVKSLGKGHSSL